MVVVWPAGQLAGQWFVQVTPPSTVWVWPHTLGVPEPPQMSGEVQLPQLAVSPPQPSATVPQFAVPQPCGTQPAVPPSGSTPVPHLLGPPPPQKPVEQV